MNPASMQRYARAAGVALLLSLVFGFLGESYLPMQYVVPGDAEATAAKILGNPTLFRLSFAAYLVEGLCDIALCVIFYILLKPVDRNLALLSAFFGMASMITFAIAQAGIFSASLTLLDTGGMDAFSAEQRSALAFLSIRIGRTIAALFLCCYGVASMLRGYLIARSGYIPRWIGVLLVIGGASFVLRSVTYIVAPAYSSMLMVLPIFPAMLSMMWWFLFRGIDTRALPAS